MLNRIRAEVTNSSHALIPQVQKVFEHVQAQASTLRVETPVGSFGLRTVISQISPSKSRRVDCNVLGRTCNGSDPDCLRPALTKEPCAHLHNADMHDGTAADPSYFDKYFPPYFRKADVLRCLSLPSMEYVPPNMALHPSRKVASSDARNPKAAKGDNVTRYSSIGEHENKV